jgi:hypothetical protein
MKPELRVPEESRAGWTEPAGHLEVILSPGNKPWGKGRSQETRMEVTILVQVMGVWTKWRCR